jgi:glycosyltransferase involved in cell wall biosynthesis
MRILTLTNQYPRLGNDRVAPYNRHQFRWLAARHELEVIAPVPWTARFRAGYQNFLAQPRRYRNRDGIWVHHSVYFFPPRLLMHRYGEFFLASVRKTARGILERFLPDVLLSCWSHPDGWATVRLAREHGLPVMIKVIGSDVLVLGREPRRRERVAEALREADGVIAVSRDLAEHVVALGVDPTRVHVVPEGIDQDLFSPGDRLESQRRLGLADDGDPPHPTKRLLFVGNLLLSKGVGVLLEAASLLHQRGVDLCCHLVGRGHDEPHLAALRQRLGLEQHVEFVGACPQWKLPDWYRACDLVVLPSFSEGIPNVLREAMMCGRAFVATRVGGIPEITRPQVGRLVEAGNPRELADAIASALAEGLVADRETALALNISWERSAQMLGAELEKVRRPSPAETEATVATVRDEADERAARKTPDRLRLLAITQIFPRPSAVTGGSYNLNQFQSLDGENAVSVISPTPWTEFRLHQLWHKARSQEVQTQFPVVRPTFVFPPKIFRSAYGLFYMASIRKQFDHAVAEFKPDAVLACWSHPDGWATVRLAREYGLPVMIKVHGSDVLVLGRDPRRRERVAEALREADGVIAVSQNLADHVIALGVEPSRVHIVPHGIDQNMFCPGDRLESQRRLGLANDDPQQHLKRLLFVGNLLLSKGVGVLLEAAALLRQRGVDFLCHLVGRGQDEPRLAALCQRLGLEEHVQFVGACPQWKLPDWYRACDLVLLPSFSEGIPNVLREAMMCGRAFVATRVGGIPEITRPQVGRLVEAGNPRELADAIASALAEGLVADRETALALNISWERSAQMLLDEFRKIVCATPRRTAPQS